MLRSCSGAASVVLDTEAESALVRCKKCDDYGTSLRGRPTLTGLRRTASGRAQASGRDLEQAAAGPRWVGVGFGPSAFARVCAGLVACAMCARCVP